MAADTRAWHSMVRKTGMGRCGMLMGLTMRETSKRIRFMDEALCIMEKIDQRIVVIGKISCSMAMVHCTTSIPFCWTDHSTITISIRSTIIGLNTKVHMLIFRQLPSRPQGWHRQIGAHQR